MSSIHEVQSSAAFRLNIQSEPSLFSERYFVHVSVTRTLCIAIIVSACVHFGLMIFYPAFSKPNEIRTRSLTVVINSTAQEHHPNQQQTATQSTANSPMYQPPQTVNEDSTEPLVATAPLRLAPPPALFSSADMSLTTTSSTATAGTQPASLTPLKAFDATQPPDETSSRPINWYKIIPDSTSIDSKPHPDRLNRFGMNHALKKRASENLTKTLNQSFLAGDNIQYGANGETFIAIDGSCFEIKEEENKQVFWFSTRCQSKNEIDVKALVEAINTSPE